MRAGLRVNLDAECFSERHARVNLDAELQIKRPDINRVYHDGPHKASGTDDRLTHNENCRKTPSLKLPPPIPTRFFAIVTSRRLSTA